MKLGIGVFATAFVCGWIVLIGFIVDLGWVQDAATAIGFAATILGIVLLARSVR